KRPFSSTEPAYLACSGVPLALGWGLRTVWRWDQDSVAVSARPPVRLGSSAWHGCPCSKLWVAGCVPALTPPAREFTTQPLRLILSSASIDRAVRWDQLKAHNQELTGKYCSNFPAGVRVAAQRPEGAEVLPGELSADPTNPAAYAQ
ncbi:TPA: hypothetical protein ACH3X1_011568, partial [Trebouxia sp. C0004]